MYNSSDGNFQSSTDNKHASSRTNEDCVPEKSSGTLADNEVKKRRVRKKKPRKKNPAQQPEVSTDANGECENADTTSAVEEVKVVKRRNRAVRNNGPDKSLDTTRTVEQVRPSSYAVLHMSRIEFEFRPT